MESSAAEPSQVLLDEQDRASQVRVAVYEFLRSRNRGENPDVVAYCERLPHLAPELRDAIDAGLRQLRHVMDAERAGPAILASQAADSTSEDAASPRQPNIKGYRIVGDVSAGSQGMVYEAIQESTGKTVALKVVSGFTKNSVARFEREARLLAGLTHPGVVSIIDRGRTAEDAYFLALEFVRGHDLDKWLSSEPSGEAGQKKIVKMFALIAQAIEAAHRQGIVHRDLKPSNILVDEYSQPRIVDFGLAQLVGDSREFAARHVTVTGNIVGSIPWASPEQASGDSHNLSPASDVYSLGVLLYEALTQTFPYVVEGPLYRVTENICKAIPKDPTDLRDLKFGRIDDALSHILLKCLAKAPGDRFVSGGELASALDAYCAGTYHVKRRRRFKKLVVIGISMAISSTIATLLAHFTPHPTAPAPAISILSLPTYVNPIGMQFVEAPKGSFLMGSPVNEQGHNDSEQLHLVHITHPFFIARTEVTRGQYQKVIGSLPAQVSEDQLDLPVDQVSWQDANAFCMALGKIDHRTYRLPTDAEWEYACRAGTSTRFTGTGNLADIAWYDGNSGQHLHAVGTKAPNRWGLFDMSGNVSEWVSDSYVAQLGESEQIDPSLVTNSDFGTVRGGNVTYALDQCRSCSAIRYASR